MVMQDDGSLGEGGFVTEYRRIWRQGLGPSLEVTFLGLFHRFAEQAIEIFRNLPKPLQ